jgi:hypothetical protein
MKYICLILCFLLLVLPATGGITMKRGPSSGATVHGVSGSVGNETTLQYLYSIKDIPMWVNGPTYYFGDGNATGDFTAAGDDTNDCLSPSTPCLSWWKLKEVCQGANCILDAGDVAWLDLNVCTDVANGGAVPQVGGAADTICDEDAVTPYSASSDFSVNTNVGKSVTDTESREPWMSIRSSRPGQRVTIVDAAVPATASVFLFSGGGTIILQDLEFSAMTTDVYLAESAVVGTPDTTHLLNNIRCTGTVGASDRCFRITGGDAIILNSEGDAVDSPIVAVSEDGRLTWISTKTLEKTSRDDNGFVVQITTPGIPNDCCARATMIGTNVTLSGAAGSQPEIIKAVPAAADEFVTMRLARMHLHGGDTVASAGSCIQFSHLGDEYVDFEIYQSTFGYCNPGLHDTDTSNVSNANHRIIAKYNVFQPGTNGNFGAWLSTTGGYESGTISIRDNIVNEESAAQPRYFAYDTAIGGNVWNTTVANMRTDMVTESAAMVVTMSDFFLEATTTSTDDDQFAGSCLITPGTGGTGICRCDRATPAECATPIPATYSIELMAPIPSAIFGSDQDVTHLILGDENTQYGAY